MADFYETMNSIFRTGEITQSRVDKQLSDCLHNSYEMEVLCSELYIAETPESKTKGKLLALIDGRKSSNDTVKLLGELKGAGNYGIHLNSFEVGKPFRDLANTIVNEYEKIVSGGYTDYDDIVVTVYDFVAKGIGYIYSAKALDVREYINKNYDVGICDIIVADDSEYMILVDTLNDFNRIINDKSEICKGIFEIMKELDYFDLLRYNELKVSFLLKEALSYEKLNRLLMRRSLC